MNTAMMVTRVSLLLVVTGLFAGMWSGDSPDLRSPAEKQMARRASTPCLLGAAKSPANRIRTVSLTQRTAPVPLPAGIEPGTYLVVNQAGETQRLTIDAKAASTTANFVAVDQYTVRQGGLRWHFIRLDNVTDRNGTQPSLTTRAVGLN